MRDCVTRGNKGYGYAIYIPTLNATSAPISLRFINCKSIGDNAGGLALTTGNTPAAAVTGLIDFINCDFIDDVHSGIRISNKPAPVCPIRFINCSIVNPAPDQPVTSPITLAAQSNASQPIGGIEFRNCLIRDTVERPPITFINASRGVGVANLTGSITVERNGGRTVLDLTPEFAAQWGPARPMVTVPPYDMTGVSFRPLSPAPADANLAPGAANLRTSAYWALYAEQGDQVRFTVHYGQIAQYSGGGPQLTVTGPSGATVATVTPVFKEETEVSFTAPATGLYHVAFEPGSNFLRAVRSTNPMEVSGERGPISLIGTTGTFYFYAPAGTKQFGIIVAGGDPGEGFKAGIYDPAGKLVEEKDDVAGAYQFVVSPPAGAPGQVWSLKLDRPSNMAMEDVSVEMAGIRRCSPARLRPCWFRRAAEFADTSDRPERHRYWRSRRMARTCEFRQRLSGEDRPAMKVAIIGCGNVARGHIRAWEDATEAQIAMLVDVERSLAEETRDRMELDSEHPHLRALRGRAGRRRHRHRGHLHPQLPAQGRDHRGAGRQQAHRDREADGLRPGGVPRAEATGERSTPSPRSPSPTRCATTR